ncbi:MAG: hypothetical protein OHK0012_21250 [Synechococcales cyanobacterium]
MNSFFRQYVIPALILVVFLFTLVVVSIRSFLPGDMAAPAPVSTLLSGSLIGFVSPVGMVGGRG